MNVKLLISSIVIAVAVFSSTAVLAKGHKSGVNMYRMLLSERAAEKLDLTATQQAKIKSIAESEKAVIELFKNNLPDNIQLVDMNVKIETDLNDLSDEEKVEFMKSW